MLCNHWNCVIVSSLTQCGSQPPEGVVGLGVLTLVIFTLGEDTIGRDGFDTHDAPRGGWIGDEVC